MTQPTITKFNIGGIRYEVSKSLLLKYPKTMLAVSASKQRQENPNDEIFIERDGERFRLVLDYMRDGCVHLPISVSKDTLLLDFKYYGFENVSTKDIHVNLALQFLQDHSTAWATDLCTKWDKRIAKHEGIIAESQRLVQQIQDSKQIISAFLKKKSLILNIPEGQNSYKNCNEFLKTAGLNVIEENYNKITLKLI